MNDALALLKKYGDPLERAIAEDHDGMEVVLYPYAEIWAEQVLSRRSPDKPDIVDDWREFAGSHYTALIRVHHALESLRGIRNSTSALEAEPHEGPALLKLHRELASFWENLGSAIDNIEMAYAKAPIPGDAPPREPALGYAYDRRTQFIHSRLVPISTGDGSIELNLSVFDQKTTLWERHCAQPEWVTSFHDQKWHETLKALGNTWQQLRSRLREAEKPALDVKGLMADPNPVIVNPSGTYILP